MTCSHIRFVYGCEDCEYEQYILDTYCVPLEEEE